VASDGAARRDVSHGFDLTSESAEWWRGPPWEFCGIRGSGLCKLAVIDVLTSNRTHHIKKFNSVSRVSLLIHI